jgi:hypothetical protein
MRLMTASLFSDASKGKSDSIDLHNNVCGNPIVGDTGGYSTIIQNSECHYPGDSKDLPHLHNVGEGLLSLSLLARKPNEDEGLNENH